MKKKTLIVIMAVVSVALCWQIHPTVVGMAQGDIPAGPCSSTVQTVGGCYVVCPDGDAEPLNSLATGDATIFLQIKNDITGEPIPGIAASDFWLVGCGGGLVLCGGSGAIDADSATNDEGRTTISGSMAASGCDIAGVCIVVQGVVLWDPQCTGPLCLPITTVSPDVPDALDGKVDLLDLSAFAFGYTSPPRPYEPCFDFACGSAVDLLDFTLFGFHYFHQC